jgi:hypothetical protein
MIERDIDRLISREEYERIEREEETDSSLLFEAQAISPYAIPLDGDTYTNMDGFGPNGLCPLCNNENHQELDKFLVMNMKNKEKLSELPFTRAQIARHIACHIGMVYARASTQAMDARPVIINSHAHSLARETAELTRAVTRALRFANVERRRYNEEEEPVTNVLMPVTPVKLPPSDALNHRPCDTDAKKWYAFNGYEQIGPLRPWGDTRMAHELEKRSRDAIVFYDEMLDVRSMSRRIYEEIMEGDGEPIVDKKGEVVGYKDKNYSAAIQAVRVIKDTAMDMGKMALIAMKYGEEKGKIQTLSPALQGMLSDMGLFNEERQVNDDPTIEAELLGEDVQAEVII